MTNIFQNDITDDGYPFYADDDFREAYPPIPMHEQRFETLRGDVVDAKPIAWQFSMTFNQWSATVAEEREGKIIAYRTRPIITD